MICARRSGAPAWRDGDRGTTSHPDQARQRPEYLRLHIVSPDTTPWRRREMDELPALPKPQPQQTSHSRQVAHYAPFQSRQFAGHAAQIMALFSSDVALQGASRGMGLRIMYNI